MSYVLHSYPDCASHVIRMVLEELALPYRDQVVEMRANAHHSGAFLSLNRRGMVPVLVDEQTNAVVAETGAILSYLTERSGALAPPHSNPKARGLFHQRLFFLSNSLHADAQLQYYTEKYVGDHLADAARPQVHSRMRAHFAMIEEAIAREGGPWLMGPDLTVCDFYLAGCARWALIAPRQAPLEAEAVTRHPMLNALLERLEIRESVVRAFELEGTARSAFFRAPVRSRHTRDV